MNYFQKRLKAELEDLLRGADCNFDSLNDSEEHLPDPIDRASSLTDRSLAQNICDRESLRLKKIEQGLEDIAIGAYGVITSYSIHYTKLYDQEAVAQRSLDNRQ